MRNIILAAAAVVMSLGVGSAVAQQEGLVNVSVEGNNVQVPIGVAAQVCPNVSADVIARGRDDQKAVCEIDQETAAEHNIGSDRGPGGSQASTEENQQTGQGQPD